jgi:hypothetical protein
MAHDAGVHNCRPAGRQLCTPDMIGGTHHGTKEQNGEWGINTVEISFLGLRF